jgi:predicted RNA-binding Zn-ribbon protein involved in translation (DUF1610 family)
MSMHLFSTPTECTHCGTVVDNPTVDKCPNCSTLLRERRTPGRLAGVERRYGNIRFLLGFLRFLGVITILVGALAFVFSDDSVPWTVRLVSILGTLLLAVGLFVVASLFEVTLDIEENTRASFRLQQMMLDGAQGQQPRPAESRSGGPAA